MWVWITEYREMINGVMDSVVMWVTSTPEKALEFIKNPGGAPITHGWFWVDPNEVDSQDIWNPNAPPEVLDGPGRYKRFIFDIKGRELDRQPLDTNGVLQEDGDGTSAT